MSLQFTQEEVERELRDIVKHGDIREISLFSGIGEKYLSSQLNPEDERKSYPFGFLQIQCALDRVSRARGDQFFNAVRRFRDQSRIRKRQDLCPNSEISKFLDEKNEFLLSRLESLPYPKQLAELDDVIRQAKRLKVALTDEYMKNNKEEE